jgi:cytochrome d ubiquinol oxidase subunit II
VSPTLGDAVAGVLLLTVAVYSVAGGTDYGAGIWDLLAGGYRRGEAVRDLVDHAMGPVWEANNVWLVLAAVVCWTGFPLLFQSVFSSLYPLFTLALLALVLRGAFFAFRKAADTPAWRMAATFVFGTASVLASFCFAAILGAVASGRVGAGVPAGPVWAACFNPTSISFGVVSLAATALSGASFLVGDARRRGQTGLVEYFRARAVLAAAATLAAGAVALAVLAVDSPGVARGMVAGRGLPFAIAAVVATLGTAMLHWRRIHRWYRVLTVVAAGSFVFAWGIGQAPYLLPGRLTIAQAVGAPSVEVLLLVVAVTALVTVVPSLGLLLYLDQRNELAPPDAE